MSLPMKKEIPLCDPYVWEDPRYLFRSTWLDRYLNRRRGVCASELVNEIIFVYIFAMKVTTVAAMNVGFPAEVAVWIPNILFGIIAYVLYKYAPK